MTKNAVATKDEAPGQELVDQAAIEAKQREIEEQIRQTRVATVSERLGNQSQRTISLKDKRFTFPGGEPKTGPIHAVVLDSIWALSYYPNGYDQSNPRQAPVCFAVAYENPERDASVTPHETAPEAQSDSCKSCPKNKFGTALNGKGKACKNQKRLIIVPPDADENTEPFTIYVSPGAVKKWDAYMNELAMRQLDPIQVVTEIDFGPEGYPTLTFKFVEKHANLITMWGLKDKYSHMTWHTPEVDTQK